MSASVTASMRAFTGEATPTTPCFWEKPLPSASYRTRPRPTTRSSPSTSPSLTGPPRLSPTNRFRTNTACVGTGASPVQPGGTPGPPPAVFGALVPARFLRRQIASFPHPIHIQSAGRKLGNLPAASRGKRYVEDIGSPQAASRALVHGEEVAAQPVPADRKSTRLNSSHRCISYAVFCLK